MAEQTTGAACGWQVAPHGDGGWQWSAYGPRGTESGYSGTKDLATACARIAYDRVRRPTLRGVDRHG